MRSPISPPGSNPKIKLFASEAFGANRKGTKMPNPKRRHSKRRTALRRAHDFISPANPGACPNCGEQKQSHRACPKCGEYNKRKVLVVTDAK